ncbi:MAG: IS21-like element helper ATPase IstB [Nocardioides sp.]
MPGGPTRSTSPRSSTVRSPPGTHPVPSYGSEPPASARKTLEEFDWDAQPAVRQQIASLASGGFLTEARNVVLLGPPRTGKTHLATGLGIAAAHHGHRVLFATATEWVTRLTDAHRAGRLPQELSRLRRYGLIIVNEVGYLPFEQDAANLFFQLVSSRYEHASLILTSNLPFSGWGGVFGDQAVAAAMIDRVVHHADVLTPEGRQLPATQPRHRHPAQHQNPRHGRLTNTNRWPHFRALPTHRQSTPGSHSWSGASCGSPPGSRGMA